MKRKLLVTAIGFLIGSSTQATIFEWSQDETRIYEEKFNAMEFQCKIAAQDAFLELQQTYFLPKKDSKVIYEMILEREKRKATYDYICKIPKERFANKKRINELYQDSIDARILPNNENLAGKNISAVLRFADKIGITTDSYNQIVNLGLSTAKNLRKNPRYNYEVEVMDSLRTFLTKEQLVKILRITNVQPAVDKGIAVWNEVKAAGLVENSDSISCCNGAIEYFLQERIINDMFVGHDKVLKNNLSDLRKQQPLIVRINDSIKKKEELLRKKEEENNEITMAW